MVLGDVVEELLEGDFATGIFQLFQDIVGEEAVVLVDEGVGRLVAVGGHEDDNVVAHTGVAVFLDVTLDVEEGLAAALDAVETGIDDEGVYLLPT